jgi:hypothetical protein
MLEEALAARKSAIDRGRLSGGGAAEPEDVARPAAEPADPEPATTRVVVALPVANAAAAQERTLVPTVAGTSIRRAANALHRRGFRVAVHGSGKALRTTPVAGDSARVGATVTIWAE